MKRLKVFAALTGLIVAVTFAWAGIASAHSFRTGTNVVVNETIRETVFASGRTVDISSEVFGDVLCAGMNITVSGTVHGDVICAGQTVNVTGKVDGDIRLAGQTVTVDAEVGGNATIGSQSFSLSSDGRIKGDVTIGSTDATFNGAVGRHLAAGSENLTVAGTVGGNVKATTTNLTLADTARVDGNVDYTSNNDLRKQDNAVVTGTVSRTEPARPTSSKSGAVFGFSLAWFIYWFLAMLFTALVLVLLFPRMFQAVSDQAVPTPWKALLVGILANVALPLVMFLFAITVIGIPLAFITLFLWFVVLLLSGPLFAYYLGRLILSDSRQSLLIMLVGGSVLLVLYFIPIIGFIALLAAMWIGAGMLLLEVFDRTPRPTYTVAEPVRPSVARGRRKS